jgi:eukaryotic-like serine/threonine-protein kinase
MPRAPDLAGAILDGRYELHALIGEGAFGRVYRGLDHRLGRAVAVKVIKPWWAEDPGWAETFEREARLLARVSDPGIVQIFDVGYERGSLYYVAELVDGESLATRLRQGPLPPWQASEIAEQLCRALAQAHAQRVVHRDLKPANVLISDRGQVKLGDFGVARLAEGSTDGLSGMVVGTPRYMAPEQARGLRSTSASDIYSVGVILYEMLAGEPPFCGDSAVELALHHAHDRPPPLPDRVPRPLASVAERALAKDPAARYPDAGAMADALRLARRGHASRQRPGAAGKSSPPRRPATGGRAARADRTRIAPRFTPRRNVSPAARRQTIAAFGLVLTVLLVMVGGAFVLAASGRVRMPNVKGMTASAITTALRHLDLHPAFSHQYDAATSGTAIRQSPRPGAWVNKGSAVPVVLSDGPPPVKVPRLIGQSSTGARTILGSLGLQATETAVPAPGVQPGEVTAQAPKPGGYVFAHGNVSLFVAETPIWRPVSSLTGQTSAPFRIRGEQWRVVYRMRYVGTCTFIFFCDGPTARIVNLSTGATGDKFDLNDGDTQTRVIRSGPGMYEIKVSPGSDTTAWSLSAQDYY